MQSPNADQQTPVRLEDLRNVLIRQEETIIFALIERAQFPLNPEVYEKNSSSAALRGLKGKYDDFNGSLLDFMLLETEKLHALMRRYTAADENAFFPHLLPEPILPALNLPRVLHPNRINMNDHITNVYLAKILPGLTASTSDPSAYGSTATADIAVLQALSKRIHFGKFIAEAKFQAETERYTALIRANDAVGIMNALTNVAVEHKVLERVKLKASTYGQDIADASAALASPTQSQQSLKVDPQLISDLYRDFVMPLTKEVEVVYLLQRVAHPAVSVVGASGSFCWQAARAHLGGEHLADECFVPAETVSQAFHDVVANRTAYAVVPLEDSKLGMAKETQAQLLRSSLKVSAEIIVPRSFVFAARDPNVAKSSEITTIFTPADAEPRLLNYAELTWPTAKVVAVTNVADAAARAADEPSASAVAITTATAASASGLKLLEAATAASAGADGKSASFIRFAVISKASPAATGDDKSCWSMVIKHEVGSLLNALEVWKRHGINLTCLESIYRQQQGGYDFFVETVGHVDDANVRAAVDQLQQSVCAVQHLGSFPVAKRQTLG